jgi:hypothetical protein
VAFMCTSYIYFIWICTQRHTEYMICTYVCIYNMCLFVYVCMYVLNIHIKLVVCVYVCKYICIKYALINWLSILGLFSPSPPLSSEFIFGLFSHSI